MYRLLSLLAILGLILSASSLDINLEIPSTTPEWYPIGEDATIKCTWSYSNDSLVDIEKEIFEWKTDTGKILKIQGCDSYSDDSFVYATSEIQESRLENEASCDDAVNYAKFTIKDFRVTDAGEFICEVSMGMFSNTKSVIIKAYAEPEVEIEDVQTYSDIRATDVEEEIEDEFGNSTATTPAPVEPMNIEVKCIATGAYPEPTSYKFYSQKNDVAEMIAEFERGDPTINSFQNETTKLWDGDVTLVLAPEKRYDQASIFCEVDLESGDSGRSGQTTISVYHDATEAFIQMDKVTAVVGDEVMITCSSDGNPAPSYQVEPEVTGGDHANVFYITNVQRSDEQEYQCVAVPQGATSTDNYIYSPAEKLVVNYMAAPIVTKSLDTVTKDDDVTLTCIVEGQPAPTVSWWKDGNRLSTSSQYTINAANYEDSGSYECVSQSSDSNIDDLSASTDVEVQGACHATMLIPTITSSQDEEFRYNMKLECAVTGNPKCTVQISHGGNYQETGVVGQNDNTYTLTYSNVEMFTEPVTFTCTADNSVGPAHNSSTVVSDKYDICCKTTATGGLSSGAVIGIILLVIVILVGIPVACYFFKKRNAQPTKKAPNDAEAAEPEKEGLNKDASSETSDASSLPPPPAEDHDHRLNSAHEMTTFSTNK